MHANTPIYTRTQTPEHKDIYTRTHRLRPSLPPHTHKTEEASTGLDAGFTRVQEPVECCTQVQVSVHHPSSGNFVKWFKLETEPRLLPTAISKTIGLHVTPPDKVCLYTTPSFKWNSSPWSILCCEDFVFQVNIKLFTDTEGMTNEQKKGGERH